MNKIFFAVLIAAMVVSYECATKCYDCSTEPCGDNIGEKKDCNIKDVTEYECAKVVNNSVILRKCIPKEGCSALASEIQEKSKDAKIYCCSDDYCNYGISILKTSMLQNALLALSGLIVLAYHLFKN